MVDFFDVIKKMFNKCWVIDTEYRQPDGDRKELRCLVAVEIYSGCEIKRWYEPGQLCPIQPGENDLLIVYSAGAEAGYFHRAGWETENLYVIDIRLLQLWIMNGSGRWDELMDIVARETGEKKRKRNLQLAAKMSGLPLIEEKTAMRDLIMSSRKSGDFSGIEREQILNYCLHDVYTSAGVAKGLWEIARLERDELYGRPLNDQDFLLMLILWGKYAWAMGVAEERGIRADYSLLKAIQKYAPVISQKLQDKVVGTIKNYDQTPQLALNKYLADNNIPWPRTGKGNLDMRQDTFRDMQGVDAIFGDLYQLVKWKATVQQLLKIVESPDGRLRPGFSPRSQATGRTTTYKPSPFGWSKWCRSLLQADPNKYLCYADYSQQEFLLQGVMSSDQNMLTDYQKGDVYVAFARRSGLMPPDGTKQSHPQGRKIAKGLILGLAYGMGEHSLATRLSCSLPDARRYISLHKKSYPCYWEFVEATQATASLTCSSISQLGWIRRYQNNGFNPRAAQNFPIQAAGADCLIMATIALFDESYEVLATVHDAVLVLLDAPEQAEGVKRIMTESILGLTGGWEVRVDAEVFEDHYIDEDGVGILREVLTTISMQSIVPEVWT